VTFVFAAVAGYGTWLVYTSLALGRTGWQPRWWDDIRRRPRRARSDDAWPLIVDEVRLLVTLAGRSVPQALVEAGRWAPPQLQVAFADAAASWHRTADADHMVGVLAAGLDDAVGTMLCEVVLAARHTAGSDLDAQLGTLHAWACAQARRRDQVMMARRAPGRGERELLVVVPLTSACVAVAAGPGRSALWTGPGVMTIALGLAVLAGCRLWAGRILGPTR
jgi:hypothetical protein